jgi:hypothetical protein
MARPKSIGYHANQRLDEAIMHQTDALRELKTVVMPGASIQEPERIFAVARAIDRLYQSTSVLKEIQAL